MAIDKRLQIKDEQGNLVDYDILASDVKFLPDGKDLPTKLAELQDEIGEGGYTPPQSGIPKTDLAQSVQTSLDKADSAYQKPASGIPATDIADGVIPDVSGLATKTELAGKVDKETGMGLSTNDYTTAEKTKLGNLPTATELATQMNAKANDNVVVKTISVNGGTPAAPVNGNVNISVEGAAGEDGITPHIGQNGNWWIGPETDSSNDTGIKAQGPQGSVTITDGNLNSLEVHNALNAQTGILGMGGAMKIKNNIDSLAASLDRLYAKLANMAFWSVADQAAAEPTPIDWSVPKKTVTLDLSDVDSNVIVSLGATTYKDGDEIQVDEGSELTLVISADSGYYLDSLPTASVGQDTIQVVANGNGTYSVTIDSVTTNITLAIEATADVTPQVSVTKNLTGVEVDSETQNVAYNQPYELTLKRHKYYFPMGTYPNDETLTVTMGGTDITSSAWDASTGKISIAHVTGTVVITMTAVSYIKYNYYINGDNGSEISETGYAITDCYIKKEDMSDYTFLLKPGLSANDTKCGLVEYNSGYVRVENWIQKYLGNDNSITHSPASSCAYLKISMFMDGGTIKAGSFLKKNSKTKTLFDTTYGLQGCTVVYNGVETTFPEITNQS